MKNYIYVLYSAKTSPSGRALGTELRDIASKKTPPVDVEFGTERRLSVVVRRRGCTPSTIVNFGGLISSVRLRGVPQYIAEKKPNTVLNHPSKVLSSSNKRAYRVEMAEKGVPSPKLWVGSPAGIPESEFPVIGRTSTHTKGHGLWFCRNRGEASSAAARGATHFMKFIKNTSEFRVHVMASSVKKEKTPDDYISVKISRKHKENPTEEDKVVKNHDRGWVFVGPGDTSKAVLSKVRDTAKLALSILDMDFGAVDIMYSEDTKECYVLETNSSPCLTDTAANTLNKYASSILRLLGISEPFSQPPTKSASVPVSGASSQKYMKNTVPKPMNIQRKLRDVDIVRKLLGRVSL